MILALEKIQVIDPTITKDDLMGYEVAIRNITHNNFQNLHTRRNITSFSGNTVKLSSAMEGVSIKDTVEITGSKYNDGLYIINALNGNTVTLDKELYQEKSEAKITKIVYPADVVRGLTEIIKYDVKMRDNKGVKSRTISRWSETYYDVNANDSVEGYPASLFKFLDKYRRLRF